MHHQPIGVEVCVKPCKLNEGPLIKHQLWYSDMEYRETKINFTEKLLRYKFSFIYCFSMEDEKTLAQLDSWIEPTRGIYDSKRLGLILGLHPYKQSIKATEIKQGVTREQAVKKSWQLDKAVFIEINSQKRENLFAPIWYLQLQYVYFRHPNTLFVPFKLQSLNQQKSCFIL